MLSLTEGELWIRDAAEAAEISLPTTVSGTNTDGQLSDVDFSTPTISFRQDVPAYGTYADIDAAFSMVEAGTGTINENGDVTVQIALAVDLHIVVPILAFATDCRAAPINLTLVSTTPYDGESVTLSAPNFSVPEVPETATCGDLVGPAVNDAVAGAGHSISMTFAGELSLPVAGEPTETSLTVDPVDGARLGQEVTLAATVVPAEEPDEPAELTGTVTFLDGATNLGTAPLAAGSASLTVTSLPAGQRSIRAVYSGAPPDWQPSSSPSAPYAVAAVPLVSTDVAGGVLIGGDKDFTVSIRNTGLGTDMDDLRLDVKMWRPGITGGSELSAVGLAHVVDGSPVPVTLTGFGTTLANPRVGSVEGDVWSVPPGQERTETFRLTVPAGVGPGPVQIAFDLVLVEDEAVVPLSSATGTVVLTAEGRFETTITSGRPGSPGRPPFIPPTPAIPPVTPVVRQGTIAEVPMVIQPRQSGLRFSGRVSFSIGGRPVVARQSSDQSLVAWAPVVPVAAGGGDYHLVVPADMALGEQLVQVRYSGDDVYAGSVASWPIRIEPARGDAYDCIYGGLYKGRFVANVVAQAAIPTVGVRGQELEVSRVEAQMFISRIGSHTRIATDLAAPTSTFDFELTGGGTGSFDTLAQSGASGMDEAGTPPVSWTISLGQGSGSLPVAHDAGTTLDIGLDGLVLDFSTEGFANVVSCQPFDDTPIRVASVLSTGTSLTVNPVEEVRQGDSVELTAQALPASPGTVEFLDGETSVGVSPVDGDGVARVTVDDLAPGTRSLTARYFGTVYPDSTSEPVELTVEGVDCFGQAEPGTEAVVRLIYLTVLNRCPDEAGFDHWTGRLDGGASRESVAKAIANSHEARTVLVDEAYGLMLERRADPEGREFWATRLRQTGSYRDLIGQLGSSSEFRTLAGGTDGDVVDRLYDRFLGRSPNTADRAFWVDRIETQGTRATVMRIFDLDEPLRTLVGDTYRAIIDRAPTATERDAGVTLMRDRSDRAALNASVIDTNDFYTRAQAFPNAT